VGVMMWTPEPTTGLLASGGLAKRRA